MIRRARTRWWARSEIGVDPLGHEVRRIGHHANPGSFGGVRSETHLQGQILGGASEIVSLLLGKLIVSSPPVCCQGNSRLSCSSASVRGMRFERTAAHRILRQQELAVAFLATGLRIARGVHQKEERSQSITDLSFHLGIFLNGEKHFGSRFVLGNHWKAAIYAEL